MGLGFLVPAFLVGLVALAVPLLLHLRHRDRDKPQRFPSLMFLEQLTIRTEQRQRVSDWPLLLLRLLVLALLVPSRSPAPCSVQRTVPAATRAVAGRGAAVDRSLSMGYERRLAPRARFGARRHRAARGVNDRVARGGLRR
jgi:hypothetical protein